VTTAADLLAARPELAEHRATMLEGLWRDSGVPPRLLELTRLRVAALLHDEAGSAARTPAAVAAGLDEDLVDALPGWPTDPRFTPTDRAALAVAEQFVMDCHGITDAQVEGLRDGLGDPATVGFLIALALFDDESRTGDVMSRLQRFGPWAVEAFKTCKMGAHERHEGELRSLIDSSKRLAQQLLELR